MGTLQRQWSVTHLIVTDNRDLGTEFCQVLGKEIGFSVRRGKNEERIRNTVGLVIEGGGSRATNLVQVESEGIVVIDHKHVILCRFCHVAWMTTKQKVNNSLQQTMCTQIGLAHVHLPVTQCVKLTMQRYIARLYYAYKGTPLDRKHKFPSPPVCTGHLPLKGSSTLSRTPFLPPLRFLSSFLPSSVPSFP